MQPDINGIIPSIIHRVSADLLEKIVLDQQAEIDRLRNVLRINTEQQAEHIKSLLESWEKERKILTDQIKSLKHRVDHAEWLVEKYREENND